MTTTSHTCPQCGFVFIGEDDRDALCPECGDDWATERLGDAILTSLPEELPTASRANNSHTLHRPIWPFSFGMLFSAVAILFLAWFSYRTFDVEIRSGESLRSMESSLVQFQDESFRTETNIDELNAALAGARESQLKAEHLQQQSVEAQQSAERRLATLAKEHQRVLADFRKQKADTDRLRKEVDWLEELVESNTLTGHSAFVRQWNILGPLKFPHSDEIIQKVEQQSFSPKLKIKGLRRMATWKELSSNQDRVSINQYFKVTDKAACYLITWVRSHKQRTVQLQVGSDDGYALWLNREQVKVHRTLRSAGPNQDQVQAELQPGWNEVLVHVDNTGGSDWAFYLEIKTEDGQTPLPLRVSPVQPPAWDIPQEECGLPDGFIR